uniref:Uncharacterized protein AlNc14C156G7658 n=1 Tax=Albugo laibachii Nc14 TaxID=890382 RepID=F0WMG8_9STRA|nr:conserved hypothetical protein [Albugo laibachii Nc14]|eukprot:CCA22500.1 conserved hypothetical protein [Albugo laibachii Nc14]
MHQSLLTIKLDDICIHLTIDRNEMSLDARKSSGKPNSSNMNRLQIAAKSFSWLNARVFLHLVHLLDVKFAQCAVNVYDDTSEDLLSAKNLDFSLQAQVDAVQEEVQICVCAFYNEPSLVTMKRCMGSVICHKTRLQANIPIIMSDGFRDLRPSILIVCSGVHVAIDYVSFLREMIFKDNIPSAKNETDNLPDINTMLHRIPKFVSIEVQQCSFTLASRADETMVTTVGKVLVQIQEPTKKNTLGSQPTERLMSIDSGPATIEIRERFRETTPCVVRWDYIKVESNWKASTSSLEVVPSVDVEPLKLKVMVETRAITLNIVKDLQNWVSMAAEASDQAVTQTKSPIEDVECKLTSRQHAKMDIQVQVKVVRTEIRLKSVEDFCDVFLKAVPDTLILIEEITVYAHPFLTEEILGVRSKSEFQCSRLQLFYLKEPQVHKMCFLSLDFMRVFLSPTTRLLGREQYAEIDLKAEWLEFKWSSQTLHAVGGMVEVLVCVIAAFIQEEPDHTSRYSNGPHPRSFVPEMKKGVDEVFSGMTDRLDFRSMITNIVVIFPSTWQDQNCVDYVSAQSLVMASCKQTNRLLLSISDIEVSTNFEVEERTETTRQDDSTSEKNMKQPQSNTRFRLYAWQPQASLRAGGNRSSSTCFSSFEKDNRAMRSSVYLYARTFALEETLLSTYNQSVLDLYVDSVWLAWDLPSQLRVMELVRRITSSAWEMIYRIRKSYAVFCTDENSRYNRPGGLNIPMNDVEECKRNEVLFEQLVSASGVKLHRLYATTISIDVSLVKGIESKLHIGVFAGYDMPDSWEFQSVCISIGTQQVLSIHDLVVRNTLNKSLDHVYGYFEQLLQVRKASTGRTCAEDLSNMDGILLTFDGVYLRLAVEFDASATMESLTKAVDPYKEDWKRITQKCWRPQHPNFSRYFQEYATRTRHQNLWIDVTGCRIECLDAPFESWLQRIHPLWVEAMEEREMMQSQMLLFEDPSVPSDPSKDVKNSVFASKAWIKRVRAITNTCKHDDEREYYTEDTRERLHIHSVIPTNGLILCLNLKQFSLDLDPQVTPKQDQNPFHSGVLIEAKNVSFQVRSFSVPLIAINQFRVYANVRKELQSEIDIENEWKYFASIEVSILTPVIAFSPRQLPSIVQLWELIASSCVPKPLDTQKSLVWDWVRHHLHGNLRVLVEDTTLRLFNPETSFDSLSISAQKWSLEWALHTICMSVDRLHLRTEPEALSNMVEISGITCEIALLWKSKVQSAFAEVKNQRLFPKHTSAWKDVYRDAASELDVHFKGEIAKTAPCSSTCERMQSKQEMASKSTIVMYLNQLEWLIEFAKAYKTLFSRKLAKAKCGLHIPNDDNAGISSNSTIIQLKKIWKSCHVDTFKISNVDAAIYANHNHLIGIRAFFNDSIDLTTELVAGISDGEPMWEIRDLAIVTRKLESRICTSHSGSRGEPFFSVQYACVHIGGSRSKLNDLQRVSSMKPSELKSRHQDFATKVDPSRSRRSILDHFAITQHNPFRFRDTEEEVATEKQQDESDCECIFLQEFRHSGYPMGFGTKEMRILITLGGIQTLLDLFHSGCHLLCIFARETSLSGSTTCHDSVEYPSEMASTPKKPTTLAEDPKFFAILNGERFESGQILQPTSHSESQSHNSIRESSSFPLDEMEASLLFKFMDCQINFQDAPHKGSTLLALHDGVLKKFVSQDSRLEMIEISVHGSESFTAPLDVDVASKAIWLRALADGSYCPTTSGLYRQVIAPMPLKVIVKISREAIIARDIQISISDLQANWHVSCKDILLQSLDSIKAILAAKDSRDAQAESLWNTQVKRLAKAGSCDAGSLKQMSLLKKQLKWEISYLQWWQICQWNASSDRRAAETDQEYFVNAFDGPRPRIPSSHSSSTPTGIYSESADPLSTEIKRAITEYDVLCEAVRRLELKAAEKSKRSSTKVEFVLHSSIIRLGAIHADILQMRLNEVVFTLKQQKDKSGACSLRIENFSCWNLSPGTCYPEMLLPTSNTTCVGEDDFFLRLDAEITRPCGELGVIQHFEVNVHPVQLCITQDLILQLSSYFSSSTETTTSQVAKKNAQHIRSQFLTLDAQSQGSCVNERLGVGTALRKAAQIASRSAPYTWASGIQIRNSTDVLRPRDWKEYITSSNRKESHIESLNDSKSAVEDDEESLDPGVRARDLSECRKFLFKHIRIGTIEAFVTYKNKDNASSQQSLEEMRGFQIKIHALVYCDKTCSLINLVLRIRRDVILDILSQVGRNFTNIANFLGDQFGTSRWANFEALAPLKTLTHVANYNYSVPFSFSGDKKSKRAKKALFKEVSIGATDTFQLALPQNHPSLRPRASTLETSSVRTRNAEPTRSFRNLFKQEECLEKSDLTISSNMSIDPKEGKRYNSFSLSTESQTDKDHLEREKRFDFFKSTKNVRKTDSTRD